LKDYLMPNKKPKRLPPQNKAKRRLFLKKKKKKKKITIKFWSLE
jgi:hypothetical protein